MLTYRSNRFGWRAWICVTAACLVLAVPARAAEDLADYGLQGLPVPTEAVKFVDGVRCGNPNDPHEVVDYGEPSRIETVLGRPARVAAGPWEVFGYTLTVAHPDRPHLVVITWPDDGWIPQFRICEQNERESPKGIGWIDDYYAWPGPAGRLNVLKAMAANPRYVVLDMGHESCAWQEANLRVLAAPWRAFPWGETEDLSATLGPAEGKVTVLRSKNRLLLPNADNVERTVSLPGGGVVDAVSGQRCSEGKIQLEPSAARTVLLSLRP